MTINEHEHKKRMKELGRFGGLVAGFLILAYLAVYLNVQYSPTVPWFLIVIIVGGYFIIPKAKNVMSMFDDTKT